MNPIFPHYVRRVRRTLLPPEAPVAVVAQSEPPKAATETKSTEPAEAGTTNESDATDTSNVGAE